MTLKWRRVPRVEGPQGFAQWARGAFPGRCQHQLGSPVLLVCPLLAKGGLAGRRAFPGQASPADLRAVFALVTGKAHEDGFS